MTIRVVLVDDQALIRAGFKAIIDSTPDLTVVGEADDGADAGSTSQGSSSSGSGGGGITFDRDASYKEAKQEVLDQFERDYIGRVYEEHGGNISKAARTAGLTRYHLRELLKKHGESDEVIHAMECHHGDYDPHSVEAVLVTAADALSAARPGARREILENYIKRLEKLESMATDFKGVEKAYAIQAGREVRVLQDGPRAAGRHTVRWDGTDGGGRPVASGTYFARLTVDGVSTVKSMALVR